MSDPIPPDYTKVPEHDPNEVRRTVSFSSEPDGCTAVRCEGGKLGRPIMVGYVEKPVAMVLRSLSELESNRERYGCLNQLAVVWTRDEDLVEELLCDAGTGWETGCGAGA
ncbi:MAG: hypothetical protein V3U38_07040 [Gemmatimonadota bacterium]|jgi:hypothetical protein